MWARKIANANPNPLFPDTHHAEGSRRAARPSGPAFVMTTDSGNDSVYVVANGINNGTWGYNNLQWYGLTYYHKFNDQWHISFETYNEHQNNVLNLDNPRRGRARRERYAVLARCHAVERTVRRALRQHDRVVVYGLGADLPDLSELQADERSTTSRIGSSGSTTSRDSAPA